MIRLLLFCAALVLWTSCHLALSSCAQEAPPPEPTVVDVIVVPQERVGSRILLLVDMSSSMRIRFGRLLGVVAEIAGQPTDHLDLAVIGFRDGLSWEGIGWTRWPTDTGWADLPDAEAVADLAEWLEGWGPGGGTDPAPALRAALLSDEDPLSVILITDGDVRPDEMSALLGALAEGQCARSELGHRPAVVAVYQFARGAEVESSALTTIGTDGRGGYWMERAARCNSRRVE